MEENIKLELLFDEKIERRNQKFYFKFLWRKKFIELRKIFILAIFLLFLGFYPIKNLDQNLLYYIAKYGGVFLMGYVLLFVYSYFKSKKKTCSKIEKLIDEFKNTENNNYIQLTDKKLEVRNQFYSVDSIWNKTNYKIVNSFLLLSFFEINLNYVFTKEEFKNAEYETFFNFFRKIF
jgi:hypothetical protein